MPSFNVDDLFNTGLKLWMVRTVIAAVELGFFEIIGGEGKGLDDVVEKGNLDRRATGMILDALIPIGLLERDDSGRYFLTEAAESYFTPGKPDYIGFRLLHMARLWKAWGELPESVRTGKPYWINHPGERDTKDMVVLAAMLFSRNYEISRRLAAVLGVGDRLKGLNILDVAAGSGAWSLGFLDMDGGSKAVAVDFEPVMKMAVEKAREVGVAERFETISGNVREVDFGENLYDVAILGHICHSEGPLHSRSLIKKTAKALKVGGKLVIADMIPDDDRRGPERPLLFAINMLVNTLEGGTFTLKEYTEWCEAAGLDNVSPIDIDRPDHSPFIVAEKQRAR